MADFTVVLLEKSETLDTPGVQEQINQALSAGKVLGLPIGSCDSQTITKARSLGLTMIVPKARSKYDIMNAIKNFF